MRTLNLNCYKKKKKKAKFQLTAVQIRSAQRLRIGPNIS